MARFTVDSFTSASVGSGATLNIERTISSNAIDIGKIVITPSGGSGSTEFYIYTTVARAAGDLIYKTLPWTSSPFYDPIEDIVGVYYQRNEGFVCRYEDSDAGLQLHLSIKNNDASSRTYDISISYDESPFGADITGVPGDLSTGGSANLLECMSGVMAGLNQSTITSAEFRAKFYAAGSLFPGSVDLTTVAEGGSFAHNGTTQLVVTGIKADDTGALYKWASPSQGRWYFAWKLTNTAGSSNWTDGNSVPAYVTDWFETNTNQDTGPPSDWQVTLERTAATNYYIVRATRPQTNGNLILNFTAQLKNVSTGSWRAVDANAGAAVTKYDGSAVNHTFDPATSILTTPGAWGTAAVGDLVVYDVNGDGTFTLADCMWATINTINATQITLNGGGGRMGLLLTAHQTASVYDQVRLKIVKPPWDWTTEGYLGAQANRGFSNDIPLLVDKNSRVFSSNPIYVDPSVTQIEARVWFQNAFSRSDNNLTTSSVVDGGSGIITEGYTWTRFTDRNWWAPIIEQGENVKWEMLSAGTCKVTAGGAAPVTGSPDYGAAGMGGRFKIYPGPSGQVIVRAKWSLNFVNDFADFGAGTSAAIVIIMNEGCAATFGGISYQTNGIAVAKYCDAAGMRLRIGHMSPWSWDTWGSIALHANVLYDVTPAPAMPVTIEVRLTIDEDLVNLNPKRVAWKTYEYQISGGGWNTVSITPGPLMYVEYNPNQAYRGWVPSIIWMQSATKSGDYATLTEFQVSKGLLVRA